MGGDCSSGSRPTTNTNLSVRAPKSASSSTCRGSWTASPPTGADPRSPRTLALALLLGTLRSWSWAPTARAPRAGTSWPRHLEPPPRGGPAARPGGTPVVKAFNTTFAGTLVAGEVDGQQLDVLIAGDDQAAKQTVSQLAYDGGRSSSSASSTSRSSSRSTSASPAPSSSTPDSGRQPRRHPLLYRGTLGQPAARSGSGRRLTGPIRLESGPEQRSSVDRERRWNP
jgi:hypothetical protein